MRAVVVHEFGGPQVLEVVDLPEPVPGPGQLAIRVAAAAVNPVDAVTRDGTLAGLGLLPAPAPGTPVGIGWDVAGEVLALGPGTAGFAVGQRVLALRDRLDLPLGSYADHLVLDASAVAPLPDGLPFAEAATLPLNGLTADQALDLLDLPPGATLLVTGAAGAVGGFAVELAARQRGLTVLAQAAPADHAALRAMGAAFVVDRAAPDLAEAVRALVPGGVDGALDTALLGIRALGAVRNRGAFVSVAGGPPPGLRGITVHTVWIAADGAALTRLAGLAAAGELTLRVADVLPLDQAATAHQRLAAGGLRGRLVLVPAPAAAR
ncbi:NADP-dependent oxidoreductase [Kitasatospora viridis]|uniref:NADPH:quinone reductase-like Zn-dependent oxidoreductase n=1 Tax=Kitasatospora viridis TaxID=281105 RepID=A0A561UIW2_9ACTN|nr:NADP-dependent oxidoreductase [Kitasatospora viridis]TWF99295.1 NADPH:quinone reductase-like Zn-dependent oxidoreductase [Kitasatospora viridis]